MKSILVILLIVVLSTSSTGRIAIRRLLLHQEIQRKVLPIPLVLNTTLLNMAAVDLSQVRFKKEIREFLIKSSSKQASKKALYDWAQSFKYDPEIMMELVNLVKNLIDGFRDSNSKYKSYAVVGNSGILLEKQYGELIDSHQVVIRLNNARTEKFERYVGSKTNISFVNSNVYHNIEERRQAVPTIMHIYQPIHVLDHYAKMNSSKRSPLLLTNGRFDALWSRILKCYSMKRFVEEEGKPLENWASPHQGSYFRYSSGMQAVMTAVGICDRVSLFGFGKSDSAKHHYHTYQLRELLLHDYEAEDDLYNDLVNNTRAVPFISLKFMFPSVVIYK